MHLNYGCMGSFNPNFKQCYYSNLQLHTLWRSSWQTRYYTKYRFHVNRRLHRWVLNHCFIVVLIIYLFLKWQDVWVRKLNMQNCKFDGTIVLTFSNCPDPDEVIANFARATVTLQINVAGKDLCTGIDNLLWGLSNVMPWGGHFTECRWLFNLAWADKIKFDRIEKDKMHKVL